MTLSGSPMELLHSVPVPVVAVVVLVQAIGWGSFLLCRGRALLLPQDSADRREVAIRRLELDHERWKTRHHPRTDMLRSLTVDVATDAIDGSDDADDEEGVQGNL
ncbi:hypothetical protein [Kitasatospora sp. NPDC096140]|uniref:hypothetical protein n=1 Tax=Kitasatospora sp. NPDC096140 TaxID=3155425 RepID=UPI00332AFCA4